jgi:hypothetical protein
LATRIWRDPSRSGLVSLFDVSAFPPTRVYNFAVLLINHQTGDTRLDNLEDALSESTIANLSHLRELPEWSDYEDDDI